jgi:hypothetical protein
MVLSSGKLLLATDVHEVRQTAKNPIPSDYDRANETKFLLAAEASGTRVDRVETGTLGKGGDVGGREALHVLDGVKTAAALRTKHLGIDDVFAVGAGHHHVSPLGEQSRDTA